MLGRIVKTSLSFEVLHVDDDIHRLGDLANSTPVYTLDSSRLDLIT